MNGTEFKREIERIFSTARAMCPNITDDMLDTNGAIYYMNGNDGTPFDWDCNDRLCEFYIFHKNERGFIKAFVDKNNTIDVYIFEDGRKYPTHRFSETLHNVKAYGFAKLMNHIADEECLWDKPIDELDWDVDIIKCDEIW